MHHRRLPPCAALGWDRHQRTEGHLPHYDPLLLRPSVCSRSGKTRLIWIIEKMQNMHHLPVCVCAGGPSLELEGVYICCMEYCVTLDGFAVILSDGRLGFITPLSNTITVDVRTLSHFFQIRELIKGKLRIQS